MTDEDLVERLAEGCSGKCPQDCPGLETVGHCKELLGREVLRRMDRKLTWQRISEACEKQAEMAAGLAAEAKAKLSGPDAPQFFLTDALYFYQQREFMYRYTIPGIVLSILSDEAAR